MHVFAGKLKEMMEVDGLVKSEEKLLELVNKIINA